MSFENPTSQIENQERNIRKGLALKSLIAITNGVLNRDAQMSQEKGFLMSAIQKAKETYEFLDTIEKQIDPTGNLSGEIEGMISSGFGKLSGWVEEKRSQKNTDADL